MGERPTLEQMREEARRRERRDMETEMALRWSKDWLLCKAAGYLLEHEAKVPEDAPEDAKAWTILLKVALRDLWDSYDFPPDWSYPRPFHDYEPPDDFDFGEVMERMHERAEERWMNKYGDADPPYGPPNLPDGTLGDDPDPSAPDGSRG